MVDVIEVYNTGTVLDDRSIAHDTVTRESVGLCLVAESNVSRIYRTLDDDIGVCSIIIEYHMVTMCRIGRCAIQEEGLTDSLLPAILACRTIPVHCACIAHALYH